MVYCMPDHQPAEAGRSRHGQAQPVHLLPGGETDKPVAVSRYRCKSELYAADLLLDVNSDIYPLEVLSRYTMRLSLTLTTDVAMQKDEYDPVPPPPLTAHRFRTGGTSEQIAITCLHLLRM